MNKASFPLALMILILIASLSIATADEEEPYDDPTVTVDVPSSITPNMDISVKINIKNTTGTRMWRSKVYIDTDSIPNNIKQYLVFYETEEYLTRHLTQQGLKDVLYPDEEVDVNFRIKANNQIPAVTIPIYVVLESEIGLCEEGCAPYKRTMQYDTEVIRDDPNIFLELGPDDIRLNVGDCYIAQGNFTVNYTLSNTSQTTAFNVDLSVVDSQIPMSSTITPQMPLSNIKPDITRNGSVYIATGNLSPGTYSVTLKVTYEDYYGKEFEDTDSFNIIVASNAYELLEQGELYLLSCDYQEAISSFEDAKELYEEVGYQELSNRCYKRIELAQGIMLFKQAQDLYFEGDVETAKATYEIAKEHYDNAEDCTGMSLCQDAINAIEQGGSATPSPGGDGNDGGLSTMVISLIIVIIVLVGIIVILLMGKR